MLSLPHFFTPALPNNINQNTITMSQKNKLRRAKREAQQEKQAKMVVTWIFAALVLFAVIFLVVFMMQQM